MTRKILSRDQIKATNHSHSLLGIDFVEIFDKNLNNSINFDFLASLSTESVQSKESNVSIKRHIKNI